VCHQTRQIPPQPTPGAGLAACRAIPSIRRIAGAGRPAHHQYRAPAAPAVGPRSASWVISVNSEEGIALLHAIANLVVDHESDGVVHGVRLAGAAGTQGDCCLADRARINLSHQPP